MIWDRSKIVKILGWFEVRVTHTFRLTLPLTVQLSGVDIELI